MRKTKIVCTIGPSCQDYSVLKELVLSGMNVARLNFAHGDYDSYRNQISTIRKVSHDLKVPVAILIDIKGPEIRIGKLRDDYYILSKGDQIVLTTEEILGTKEKVHVNHPKFPEDVQIGSKVLIDDGSIELKVVKTEGTEVFCEIMEGGKLKPRKGVNLPGVIVSLPGVTDRDIEQIKFGVEQKIDFIAASFVRKHTDILEIKRLLFELSASHIQVISKIENQEGITNFERILEVSDGIMVARGDLGVEIPIEEVPIVQKAMIKKCNLLGKPVITATQMLDSMQENPRPTRAEASDVANAILDGTDAIMLSGETAAGKYPVESVQTMSRIAEFTEKENPTVVSSEMKTDITEAIAQACVVTSDHVSAKAIITPTETGFTARMVSKYRPNVPVIAVTTNEQTLRSLSLVSGVYPILGSYSETLEDMFESAIARVLKSSLVDKGDTVVITSGYTVGKSGATNLLKIHKI